MVPSKLGSILPSLLATEAGGGGRGPLLAALWDGERRRLASGSGQRRDSVVGRLSGRGRRRTCQRAQSCEATRGDL